MTVYVGIDPGKSGAVATLGGGYAGKERWVKMFWTPTIKVGNSKPQFDTAGMFKILQTIAYEGGSIIVTLEKQQAMPGQGVSSTFQTGYGFGLWEGLIVGLGLSYTVVHPRTWKREMLKDIPGEDQKGRSIIAAQRLFPKIDLKRTPRCKKVDHNAAEAILIAEYGRRKC